MPFAKDESMSLTTTWGDMSIYPLIPVIVDVLDRVAARSKGLNGMLQIASLADDPRPAMLATGADKIKKSVVVRT